MRHINLHLHYITLHYQAALLTAALTREAGGAVVRTYWEWETTATLRLLGSARGAEAPTGEGEGTGAYRVATRTACYDDENPKKRIKAVDIKFPLSPSCDNLLAVC